MSTSGPNANAGDGNKSSSSTPAPTMTERPVAALANTQSTSAALTTTQGEQSGTGKKRRNHRAGRKKKTRRQSFAVGVDDTATANPSRSNHDLLELQSSATARPPFYRLGQSGGRNLSDISLDSQELLDHRDQQPMRPRRDSRINQSAFAARPAHDFNSPHRPSYLHRHGSHEGGRSRPLPSHQPSGGLSDNDHRTTTDRTPLLSESTRDAAVSTYTSGYGGFGGRPRHGSRNRPTSVASSISSRRRRRPSRQATEPLSFGHDVNNPPSVPGSPILGPDPGYDDVMAAGSFGPRSPQERRTNGSLRNDQVIDIDNEQPYQGFEGHLPAAARPDDHRRHTVAFGAEEDVCFPVDGLSEIAEDESVAPGPSPESRAGPRRRRYRQWPDLSVLDEWSREEKEERSDGIRAKKISEPVLVGGRLRPQKHGWHRTEEDAPYRFTYFNEEFPSTIHSQTISELLQPGQTFNELFIPEPPELSDESSDDEDIMSQQGMPNWRQEVTSNAQSRIGTRHSSIVGGPTTTSPEASGQSGTATPLQSTEPQAKETPKRYGSRPTFWLDVLSPTDTEMRVISKTFGIHPLTTEDIMMQEAREKVELFRNYYFVNYRTFEQDVNSEDYLEPVNMYVVVFREGVISFHFSMTPHPANVRRRIRQLKDYLILSSDWISYAIIDDVTDVFAPLIQSIEEEVDDIDDAILQLHTSNKEMQEKDKSSSDKGSDNGELTSGESGGDMLRRVGEGRKKVMGLYRLLGNKADVIKGFAKRCNEHWDIAPRSEIGLYLGDIQDHILTMTGNLGHYETLLSRAHSNYLAQINIRMNERQEQTADVLGRLTVLGTIVLPMNIITGMWGMNVLVPGQGADHLVWFWCITAGLLMFGVSCFFVAKRVYGIV